MRKVIAWSSAIALGLSAGAAIAHTPADLVDLIGMRGAFIEKEMTGHGYTLHKAQGAQYWWNGAQHTCAAVSTSNGRVAAITTVPAAKCGQSAPAMHLPAHASGLAGIKGMNAIAAIDAMSERGFANVDSFSMANTQYGIYYNKGSGLCAQLTMADGKVLDAADIHTHPKCH